MFICPSVYGPAAVLDDNLLLGHGSIELAQRRLRGAAALLRLGVDLQRSGRSASAAAPPTPACGSPCLLQVRAVAAARSNDLAGPGSTPTSGSDSSLSASSRPTVDRSMDLNRDRARLGGVLLGLLARRLLALRLGLRDGGGVGAVLTSVSGRTSVTYGPKRPFFAMIMLPDADPRPARDRRRRPSSATRGPSRSYSSGAAMSSGTRRFSSVTNGPLTAQAQLDAVLLQDGVGLAGVDLAQGSRPCRPPSRFASSPW